VTHLNLQEIELLICPDQFAAICELTNLVELTISGLGVHVVEEVCSILASI
jgi:hypothetical protein